MTYRGALSLQLKHIICKLQVMRHFPPPLIDNTSLTGVTFKLNNLLPNVKYYWRVRANNIGGSSEFSPIWNFTTGTFVLPFPLLSLPLNNAFDQSTSSTQFSWNPVPYAGSYRIQVSEDALFSNLRLDASLTGTTCGYSNLPPNTKFYWRVRAQNTDGDSEFSEIRNFTTAYTYPILLFPANYSVNQPTSVILKWNLFPTSTSYNLQVSTAENFSTTLISKTGISGTSYDLSGLSNNTIYYWRISSANGTTNSPWSNTWVF